MNHHTDPLHLYHLTPRETSIGVTIRAKAILPKENKSMESNLLGADSHNADILPRTCAVCGTTIVFRRLLARDWDHVEFCSAACRRISTDRARMGPPASHAGVSPLGVRK
jgi:hypothetical protein